MIIKVDNSNAKHYEKLFEDAYKVLRENGKIQENQIGRLTSLEEFFSYIADIYHADRTFLIKLPVDEPVLAIDANKRTIDTTLFNRTASVQSDEVAEIAIFSIDRYFDYMDLSTTEIWVQWTAPGLDGLPREGATLITMVDKETEPGKIRFGWPLDSEITAVSGNVQFAVRFFKRGDVTVPGIDGESTVLTNKIVYSLNTLPATLRISSALQPELNDATEVNDPQGLFAKAIVNSIYTGKDVVVPLTPSFEEPGLNLPITATLHNDTLMLKAQAVVGDTGNIRYQWYYSPVGEDDKLYPIEEFSIGEVGHLYAEIDNQKEVLSERYYIAIEIDEDGKPIAFKPYDKTEGFPPVENAKLYEKFTTFTIPRLEEDDEHVEVTGTYRVYAFNDVTVQDKVVTSLAGKSKPCRLVSPSDVVIVEELPNLAVMIATEENAAPSTILKIGVDRPEGDNSIYTYNWQKSLTKNGEMESLEGFIDANTYEITTPGWYTVQINSHLNRQTNEGTSKVKTKVTFMPEAPELTHDNEDYSVNPDDATSIMVTGVPTGEKATFEFSAKVELAGNDPDLYDSNNLYSEGLTYQWIVTEVDKEPRPLKTSEIVEGNINSNKVAVLKDGLEKIYTCVVTNTLNEQTENSQLSFMIQ